MKDIKNIKLPRVLKYTDRLSMANGIETRVPFLDHKLLSLILILKIFINLEMVKLDGSLKSF